MITRRFSGWVAPGQSENTDSKDLVADISTLFYHRSDDCREDDCLPGEEARFVQIIIKVGA